jgi:hypothetical protein
MLEEIDEFKRILSIVKQEFIEKLEVLKKEFETEKGVIVSIPQRAICFHLDLDEIDAFLQKNSHL